MDISASSVLAQKNVQLQQRMEIAVIKQQNEMELQLINMLAESADRTKATPQNGTGSRVDISA
jgi:hypothetical protein